MITNSTQNWSIGQMVQVGFQTLEVMGMEGGEYILRSKKGNWYAFAPHNGIHAISAAR